MNAEIGNNDCYTYVKSVIKLLSSLAALTNENPSYAHAGVGYAGD